MTLYSDKSTRQFQMNARIPGKSQAQTSRVKRKAVEKGWKRSAWMLAIFTFAASVPNFVEYYPVWELILCVLLAAAVFGLVRIGLQMVKGFYEQLPRNYNGYTS